MNSMALAGGLRSRSESSPPSQRLARHRQAPPPHALACDLQASIRNVCQSHLKLWDPSLEGVRMLELSPPDRLCFHLCCFRHVPSFQHIQNKSRYPKLGANTLYLARGLDAARQSTRVATCRALQIRCCKEFEDERCVFLHHTHQQKHAPKSVLKAAATKRGVMSGYQSIAPKPTSGASTDEGKHENPRHHRLAGSGPACKSCQVSHNLGFLRPELD